MLTIFVATYKKIDMALPTALAPRAMIKYYYEVSRVTAGIAAPPQKARQVTYGCCRAQSFFLMPNAQHRIAFADALRFSRTSPSTRSAPDISSITAKSQRAEAHHRARASTTPRGRRRSSAADAITSTASHSPSRRLVYIFQTSPP